MHINFAISLVALNTFLLAITVESVTHHLPHFFNTKSSRYALETANEGVKNYKVEQNFRLPNETYPEHYNIKLTTNVHKGKKRFQGEVIIDIVVAKATSKIVLHARKLELSQISITSPFTAEKEELSYEYETEREFLTLSRKNGKEFGAETKWKLNIVYNGKLRDDNRGFYISKFIDVNGNSRYLATTQFQSTNARYAFPCYDEPNKRANFTITIVHSPTYKAISNMPVNEDLSSSGKTVFLTTASIPTYIVALIVSDFENTEGTLNSLPQRIYSRDSAKHSQEWALVSSILIAKRLSQYYGVDFMLPKIDHVAIPDSSISSIENWGLATYREDYLLYDERNSSTFTQTRISNTLAHEITHQWFGGLVSIKWWTYLWLKEGLATLFSYRAMADTYPEWDVWQEFHASDYQSALINDGISNPRPMTHYVQKPHEISSLYDSVSCGKAGSVLYMWSNALTDKVFQRGLHNYLTVNQYAAAAEEQLFTAIQIAAKEENYKIPAKIEAMMGSWSRQGGYPLLTITRNYEDGTFTIKQEPFHSDTTFKNEKTWYVPVNYVVASKPDFHDTEATYYLMNVTEMKINVKADKQDWLLLNKQSAYYYRVKYDEKNYKLIIDYLIKRPFKIHVRNRAQLMHDAFAFSVSNRMDHGLLLEMMTYLKKEDQYAPWATASYIFKTFYKYLGVDRNYNDLKFFIADQIGPIYEKLGLKDVPGEQHYQKYIRNVIIDLACLAGVEDCLQETNNKLEAFVKDNTAIEPNLQNVVYCNGLKQSSDEVFEFVYKQLMDSTDQALRRLVISSVGCSQNENHIKKFIYSSIDYTNKLRIQERYTLLSPVYSRSSMGLLACIDFLDKNWNEYGNLAYGFSDSNPLDDDIRGMAFYVVNNNQKERYLALLTKVKERKYVASNLETEVKATINTNFLWLKNNRESLMTWLAQYHADKSSDSSACPTTTAVLITLSFVAIVLR